MAPTDPGQAIRNAVEAEMAAARFYRLLAQSTEDPESRAFLEDMAVQEVSHAQAIEKAGEKLIAEGLPEHAVGRVEVVETLPSWRFVDDLTLDQAYEVAITAERQAALYYDAFADSLEGSVAAFFRQLAKQEEEHEQELMRRRSAAGSGD